MIYLASPYSTPEDGTTREQRYRLVRRATEVWIKQNYVIFSPIVYTHHLNIGGVDARTWKQFNDAIQKTCSSLWVLKIPGWDKSVGVLGEIELAVSIGQRIEYKTHPANTSPIASVQPEVSTPKVVVPKFEKGDRVVLKIIEGFKSLKVYRVVNMNHYEESIIGEPQYRLSAEDSASPEIWVYERFLEKYVSKELPPFKFEVGEYVTYGYSHRQVKYRFTEQGVNKYQITTVNDGIVVVIEDELMKIT